MCKNIFYDFKPFLHGYLFQLFILYNKIWIFSENDNEEKSGDTMLTKSAFCIYECIAKITNIL
jgi:hypothetical protein